MKEKVYTACVRSVMLYGSETWAINAEQIARFDRTEMRMVRWMCGVTLRERYSNIILREKIGIEPVGEVMRRRRLRWLGHVLRKDDEDWVKKCMDMEVDGRRGRGRPRKRWIEVVTCDMKERGLLREDIFDRGRWRLLSWGISADPCISRQNSRHTLLFVVVDSTGRSKRAGLITNSKTVIVFKFSLQPEFILPTDVSSTEGRNKIFSR